MADAQGSFRVWVYDAVSNALMWTVGWALTSPAREIRLFLVYFFVSGRWCLYLVCVWVVLSVRGARVDNMHIRHVTFSRGGPCLCVEVVLGV